MKRLLICYSLGAALCLLSTACKKDISDKSFNDAKLMADANKAKPDKSIATITVQAGQSIQAAVDAASPGTLIKIKAGVYVEAIVVNKANITIRGDGESNVIIRNPGTSNNGITVRGDGDGFVLEHVTLKNFMRNGVFMIGVDGFTLSHITTINCGEYGLYPIRCTNGVIEHCTASGHNDSGIYIGQSTQIQLNHNEAFENVIGIEIENCSNVSIDKNHSYNNAAGILVVLLPNLGVKNTTSITLTKNKVNDNNHFNFADPTAGFEIAVPSGSGILLIGAKNSVIADNHVKGNTFVGVAVVSTTILGALLGLPPSAFADIDPIASGNKVIGNHVTNNGSNPPPLPLPGVDLLWDGLGAGNCWSNNKFNTSYPSPLPACI